MRKTRGISVAGSAIVVIAVALDFYRTFFALSVAEVSIFDHNELAWTVGKDVVLLLVVMAAFVLRIIILSSAKSTPYYKFVSSWSFAMTALLGYAWITNTTAPPLPDCTSGEGEICFGIYDISVSLSWVRMMAILCLPMSALRSLATAVVAAIKYQYK